MQPRGLEGLYSNAKKLTIANFRVGRLRPMAPLSSLALEFSSGKDENSLRSDIRPAVSDENPCVRRHTQGGKPVEGKS